MRGKISGSARLARRALLLLAMLIGLVSFAPGSAYAAPEEEYDLYFGGVVRGTQVTSDNKDDVFGDGTVSYDPATDTLTFNNAHLTEDILRLSGDNTTLVIEVHGDCVIDTVGTDTLNGISLQRIQGVSFGEIQSDLLITGPGSLTIKARMGINARGVTVRDSTLNIEIPSPDGYSYPAIQTYNEGVNFINSTVTITLEVPESNGIYAEEGGISIQNSTVTVSAPDSTYPALWALENLTISDGSEVHATAGDGNAIYCYDISVDGSWLDASSGYGITVYSEGDAIDIKNGATLTATSKEDCALYSEYATVTVSGKSEVTLSTEWGYAAESPKVIIEDGSTVDVTGETAGIFAGESISIADSTVTARHTGSTGAGIAATGQLGITGASKVESTGLRATDPIVVEPATGALVEVKTGATADALAHRQGSPYDQRTELGTSISELVLIQPHVHAGGAATCTDLAVCDDCGRAYGDVDPSNHSFTTYVYNGDATCEADGTETATCDRCGVENTRTAADTARGHSYVDGICTVCGAEDPGYAATGGSADDDSLKDGGSEATILATGDPSLAMAAVPAAAGLLAVCAGAVARRRM